MDFVFAYLTKGIPPCGEAFSISSILLSSSNNINKSMWKEVKHGKNPIFCTGIWGLSLAINKVGNCAKDLET